MTIYTQTARFDHAQRALTEDELRRICPSVFATQAHESRSERFAPIPTIEVIRELEKEGFGVVGATQAVAKQAGRRDYTKHLLRIRQLRNSLKHSVGDTVFEMLLKNANDGTCQYELMGGLFKVQCLNSLVAQLATVEAVKVRHSGRVADRVIEGTYRVMEHADAALEAPVAWSQIRLMDDEQRVFAEGARTLRFGDAKGDVRSPIEAGDLLRARRTADTGNDLWSTFNRVQENCIKGGLTGYARDARNRFVRRTTRPIRGIDQDVKLNRALFTLAAEMAKLKG